MKRMAALIGALLMTLVVAAPPAAAKADTVTVAAVGCSSGVGPDFRDWGRPFHRRTRVRRLATAKTTIKDTPDAEDCA